MTGKKRKADNYIKPPPSPTKFENKTQVRRRAVSRACGTPQPISIDNTSTKISCLNRSFIASCVRAFEKQMDYDFSGLFGQYSKHLSDIKGEGVPMKFADVFGEKVFDLGKGDETFQNLFGGFIKNSGDEESKNKEKVTRDNGLFGSNIDNEIKKQFENKNKNNNLKFDSSKNNNNLIERNDNIYSKFSGVKNNEDMIEQENENIFDTKNKKYKNNEKDFNTKFNVVDKIGDIVKQDSLIHENNNANNLDNIINKNKTIENNQNNNKLENNNDKKNFFNLDENKKDFNFINNQNIFNNNNKINSFTNKQNCTDLNIEKNKNNFLIHENTNKKEQNLFSNDFNFKNDSLNNKNEFEYKNNVFPSLNNKKNNNLKCNDLDSNQNENSKLKTFMHSKNNDKNSFLDMHKTDNNLFCSSQDEDSRKTKKINNNGSNIFENTLNVNQNNTSNVANNVFLSNNPLLKNTSNNFLNTIKQENPFTSNKTLDPDRKNFLQFANKSNPFTLNINPKDIKIATDIKKGKPLIFNTNNNKLQYEPHKKNLLDSNKIMANDAQNSIGDLNKHFSIGEQQENNVTQQVNNDLLTENNKTQQKNNNLTTADITQNGQTQKDSNIPVQSNQNNDSLSILKDKNNVLCKNTNKTENNLIKKLDNVENDTLESLIVDNKTNKQTNKYEKNETDIGTQNLKHKKGRKKN